MVILSIMNASNPTLRDLASEIGNVLIRWCFLESAMRAQLQEAGMQERITKGPIISHWRSHMRVRRAAQADHDVIAAHLDAVEKVAASRNLLAHCIHSAFADPWEADSAVVVCKAADGKEHELTIEMIRRLSEEIDWVRRLIDGHIRL